MGLVRRPNLFLHRNTLSKCTRWGQESHPITHLQKPVDVGPPPENVWLTTAEDKAATLINALRICNMAVLGGTCQVMFGFGPTTCDSVKDSSRQWVENGLLSFFKAQHLIPHWLACQILRNVMSQGRFRSSSDCQLDCTALYQWKLSWCGIQNVMKGSTSLEKLTCSNRGAGPRRPRHMGKK